MNKTVRVLLLAAAPAAAPCCPPADGMKFIALVDNPGARLSAQAQYTNVSAPPQRKAPPLLI
jgi:hypothetical protein